MDFLDGLLIRDTSLILKEDSPSVQDKLLEKAKVHQNKLRPFTMSEIKQHLDNAKENVTGNIQLNRTEAQPDKDGIMPTTTTAGEILKINDAVIMSALWQIKPHLNKELFNKLQEIFKPRKKSSIKIKGISTDEEKVFVRFLDAMERGDTLSPTLQNDMFDFGLLDVKFLLLLQDVGTKGERKLHNTIYDRLVKIEWENKQKKVVPTELFERSMQKLEELSGISRPDKNSIIREYKLLRDQKNLSVVDIARLVNTKKYRFQGQTTKKHLSTITDKLNELLNDEWDNILNLFMRNIEILDESTNESFTEKKYGTQNLDDELVAEWNSLKDNKNNKTSYEEIRGKKYKSAIKKLELSYNRINKYFKAARRLTQLLEENTFVSEDIDYSLIEQEKEFHNDYKNIKDNIEEYDNYAKQIKDQEKAALQRQKEWEAKKKEAQTTDVRTEKIPIKDNKQVQHQSKANKLSEEEKKLQMHRSTKEKSIDEWLSRMGVQKDKLKEILEERRKKE
tara:strand:- start:4521 stop:6038 length:1518 start_codon:yes stop_codon:yes gene_type:complete